MTFSMRSYATLSTENAIRILCLFLIVIAVWSIVRLAWFSDDSFISFRSALNLAQGYGPVFNRLERVQAFTHPLWMGMVSLAYWLTGQLYAPVLGLQFFAAGACLILLYRMGRDHGLLRPLVLGALAFSAAFTEYATSGLENAWSALLVLCFLILATRLNASRRDYGLIGLAAALLLLMRQDFAALIAPVLLWAFWRARKTRGAQAAFIFGFVPLVAWTAFSVIYYGSLVPNPAISKLAAGLPRSRYIEVGLDYYVETAIHDPITLVLIASGLLFGLLSRDTLPRLVALGLILYGIGIVWAGGDFMRGRFFMVPAVAAAWLILKADLKKPNLSRTAFLLAALTIVFAPQWPATRHIRTQGEAPYVSLNGIADEHAFYYLNLGLLSPTRQFHSLSGWSQNSGVNPTFYDVVGALGRPAILNPTHHLVDIPALSNAFLARLPSYYRTVFAQQFRIGHLARPIPEGYLASLATGENRIQDPDLAEFYNDVQRIISIANPLLDKERLLTIIRLSFGLRPFSRPFENAGDFPSIPYDRLMTRIRESHDIPNMAKGFYFSLGLNITWDNNVTAKSLGFQTDRRRRKVIHTIMFWQSGKLIEILDSSESLKIEDREIFVRKNPEPFDKITLDVSYNPIIVDMKLEP